ncbi:MAG: aromatic ring-hydroxylating dioxygenase subunit alpha [Rhodospirillaceae bacterium]|jgi:vanillate O-demethylase monooxygenase subunit|nr:aromatic ring-hydroxylating dioxygenase subunit alpha [Rhodospirillaceae bacterium]MBT4116384.1 aromatic ring-hydroxylating dioxygenase subunit alpha [Rhodospirillaceae bacterium]MBT4671085.1 aromatic ring-hydroxylating dioxygenase subunit alpha [Rhodospirillaceae bacterium]MBT5178817.1 aromatic ring-hydroxylating dioxygenase subunit alpha [Rhodospirillaceae bacterium]MBT5839038.1 aromatic ring-hydroxylating dioxygenase subunit alpha [Rhodospirillaceae bacterium]
MFLQNYWYVAAESFEVNRQPTPRIILGEPVVLYRTQDGTTVALEDRCCHQRAPLHRGKLEGDAIRCGYHGLVFDQHGVCTEIPEQERIPSSARVRAYASAEKHGWVWVWMGDSALADESLIPDFHLNIDAEWTSFQGIIEMDGASMLMVDNLLDLSHLPFLHAANIGSATDTDPDLSVEKGEGFVRVTRIARGIKSSKWQNDLGIQGNVTQEKVITFRPPCHIWIAIDTTEEAGPESGGNGQMMRQMILNSMTPVSETSCRYHWGFARDFSRGNAGVTKYMKDATDIAFNEDKEMIDAQQKIIDLDPAAPIFNLDGDEGGVAARRLMARLLAEQAGA